MSGFTVTLLAVSDRTGPEFDRWVAWVGILGLPMTALGTALAVFDRIRPRTEPPVDVDGAVAALADEMNRQWADEAVLRRTRPVPLRLRWSSRGRSAPRSAVLDPKALDSREAPLAGYVDDVVAAFQGLLHRQLVVIGEPGAGKTTLAMLLTLGLLRRLDRGEPVPALVPVGSWNPIAESLETFIVRRLVEDYAAFLKQHAARPADVARRLVAGAHVLPVLDGLDELPTRWHGQAIKAVDRFAAAPRQALVVTCRSREYERAVRSSEPLAGAAVVELQPVDVEEAIEYLSQSALAPARWEQLFDHLRGNRKGALARALSTPLLVTLARDAYWDPGSDPTDLLALPDLAAVTGALVDSFIASRYQPELPPRPGDIGRPARRYEPQRARRWLSCLAYQMYRAGTRELWWWQLTPRLMASRPPLTSGGLSLLAALVPAAAVGAAVGLMHGTPAGFWAAVLTALLGFALQGEGDRPARHDGYLPRTAIYLPGPMRNTGEFMRQLFFGVLIGLLTGLLVNDIRLGIASCLICELVTFLVPPLPTPIQARRPTPRATVRVNRVETATAAAQYGLTNGLIFAAVAATTATAVPVPVAGCAAGGVYALIAAVDRGLGRWARFRAAHFRLAARRWLPWRLWAFLDDAHRRGVLRQAGTAFQFGHAILQDHLARTALLSHQRQQARAGVWRGTAGLVQLLAEQGRIDELRTRADEGDHEARRLLADILAVRGEIDEALSLLQAGADDSSLGSFRTRERLAEILAAQGCLDELRNRADAGDGYAARELAGILARRGRLDELRTRAEAGDKAATRRLADILVRKGQPEQALAALRTPADAGDGAAARQLVDILAEFGRLDELRTRADAGDENAARRLGDILASQGDFAEAAELVRTRVDDRDGTATRQLAGILAAQGRYDDAIELLDRRRRYNRNASYGRYSRDSTAPTQLVDILATKGRERELHGLALPFKPPRATPRVDGYAAKRLADVLIDRGDIAKALKFLHEVAGRGDENAKRRLSELLAREGRVDELRRRMMDGDQYSVEALAGLLAARGQIDELRNWVATGNLPAARHLADVCVARGDVDEAIELLRGLAEKGDAEAARRLATHLAARGDVDEALALLRHHVEEERLHIVVPFSKDLADILAEHDRIDELRARAIVNDPARRRLADFLAAHGLVEELRVRAGTGDQYSAERLADVLAEQGCFDELRTRAGDGDGPAARRLAGFLTAQDNVDQAVEILRVHANAGDDSAARQLGDILAARADAPAPNRAE